MKILVKMFFRGLRIVLGPFMLLGEFLTRPRGIERAAGDQAEVDRLCRTLVLYQFRTCPFCIKVRQEMRRLALPIETRDAQHVAVNRETLLAGGGKLMVPCLQVVDDRGNAEWIYESGRIIAYLRQRFAGTAASGRP